MPDGLDDRDEFSAGGYAPPTPEELVEIEKYLAHRKTLKSRDEFPRGSAYRFPHTVVNSDQMAGGKRTIDIQCQFPGCQNTRRVFVSDLFQVYECIEHRDLMRRYNRTIRAERIAQRMRELGMTESAQPLDDQDEFAPGPLPPDPLRPDVVQGSMRYDPTTMKQELEIRCQVPNCGRTRWIFTANLFHRDNRFCKEHLNVRVESAGLDDRDEFKVDTFCEMPDCMRPPMDGYSHCEVHGRRRPVSNPPVTEELGGIRPAHLLVKAKHDSSWIEYVDAEGNTKFMQVHDVRSARDAYGRWAVYGIDQNGDAVHELYDLRHGFEHSGTFSGIRELQFGEIVKLAQQGVIRGKDGKEIQTLGGLMQIADEPLRKMIIKKAKEAKAGGPPLADIEKQLFAEPTASSAQKRAGKAGTRPWARKLMSS